MFVSAIYQKRRGSFHLYAGNITAICITTKVPFRLCLFKVVTLNVIKNLVTFRRCI
jgi:hypothetical protein